MGLRIAVIGAAGYVGGELLRLLSQHPGVDEWIATSRSQAGMRVDEVHPALGSFHRCHDSPERVPPRPPRGEMLYFWPWSTASRPRLRRKS